MSEPPTRCEPGSPGTIAQDRWLRCLSCDYSLTGLTEDRCPECGSPFDREHLAALASGDPQPVSPWGDADTIGLWRAFGRTCWATWFHPRAFAKTFPVNPRAESGWYFSLIAYALATIMIAVSTLQLDNLGDTLEFMGVLVVVALPSVIACETLLAGLLARMLKPTRARKAVRYPFWRGLTHFTSSYVIVWAAVVSVVAIAGRVTQWVLLSPTTEITFMALGQSAAVLSPLLWWRALGLAILERGKGSTIRRAIAVLAVPVIAVVTLVLSTVLCFLIVTSCVHI